MKILIVISVAAVALIAGCNSDNSTDTTVAVPVETAERDNSREIIARVARSPEGDLVITLPDIGFQLPVSGVSISETPIVRAGESQLELWFLKQQVVYTLNFRIDIAGEVSTASHLWHIRLE